MFTSRTNRQGPSRRAAETFSDRLMEARVWSC